MAETLTHLKFWAGLTSIGGTVVSIESGNHRLIFDFGLSYSPGDAYLDGQVKPRGSMQIHDYLRLGMIPPIHGLYRHGERFEALAIQRAEACNWQTAVLVSHLHLDHMGAMGLVDPSIPVYLTKDSHALYTYLQHIGEGVVGERHYSTCEFDRPFTHGPFTITPLAVDHDIPGACSFHINTPQGTLLYTGDFRLHGSQPETAPLWLEKARALGVDILICEGTTLRLPEEGQEEILLGDSSHPANLTGEGQLPTKIHATVSTSDQLAVFNLYHRNLVRVSTMLEVGKLSNRAVVLEPETAYLAVNLLGRADFSVFVGENTRSEVLSGRCLPWKTEILAKSAQVTAEMVRKTPQGYLLQNSYTNCLELLDLMDIGGCYIHSNGTPLGPFDPAHARLKKLLERVNLDYHYVGTSGHAIPQHLQFVCDTLAPKVLVPLHSFSPQLLQANYGQQLLPSTEVLYALKDGHISAI